MIYLLVKAAHLLAMVIWLSGMILVPLLMARSAGRVMVADTAQALRQALALSSAAMVAVWVLGLTLAQMGGAFADGWLQAKLALVLVLSGLHGALVGQLRRAAGGAVVSPFPGLAAGVVLGLLAGILVLAVVRPF